MLGVLELGNTLFYPNLSYEFHDHLKQCGQPFTL